ncbi:MAG TPA: 3'(2'),5'-bisphosphate nucleotidase CysQ [Segeticoccus sp.]|nr:3'(2'),5'-bisphosphate nucleotidase CysQ [Segeticoccus sp.]
MTTDADLARDLAQGAGRLLLQVRTEETDGPTLKRRGDAESHEWLMARLTEAVPGDAVLSEEGKDDHVRLEADRVWIVDPLDGTREYSEVPRDDWAVHVALWQRGRLTEGAVALPARDQVFSSGRAPALPQRSGPIRLAVSRSRPPAFVTALAEELGAELVPMGSAGVKAMAVVSGQADAYVHAGGQYEWDSAAPVAVAEAVGLRTSRVDGSPLEYNRPDPLLPDLVIAHPDVVEQVMAGIRSVG